MIKDHGGSAFPDFPIYELEEEDGVYSITHDQQSLGMTLRDYFAAKAMQGLLSDGVGKNSDIHIIASDAYFVADAMIRVRDL
jgi:hypothetical protein